MNLDSTLISGMAYLMDNFQRCHLLRYEQDGFAYLWVFAANADCAGNPIDDDQQQQQLQKAVIFLKEKYPGIEIIALWIDQQHRVHKCV